MITALLFLAGVTLVVGGSELFTNAVEWAGFRLRLGSGATGSLLAAIGAALPETAVPVVALIGHAKNSNEVAVGAVVGAPFLLVTVGMGATGLAVAARRGADVLRLDSSQVRRDLGSFVGAFWILLIAVVLPHWARAIGAVVLLLIYAAYARNTLRGGVPVEEMPEPLHLLRWHEDRHGRPQAWVIVVQLALAVGLLVGGAQVFVDGLDRLATSVHIAPLLLALVLVPLATEMPETLNSVLWVRSRSDGLAFGNVAGGMTFQACLLGALGLAFTTWQPGRLGVINLGLTAIGGMYTLALLHDGRCRGWRLSLNAVPWVVYVAIALTVGSQPA